MIENPSERIEQARRHRLQRLQQVVSAVRSGIPADAEALVEAVYNDVRPELHDRARSLGERPAAAMPSTEGILQENLLAPGGLVPPWHAIEPACKCPAG